MQLNKAWRRATAIILGSAVVGSSLVAAATVSAQAPPSLPSLYIIRSVKSETGAAVTSGTVAAFVGTTKCQEKSLSSYGEVALEVGQPSQPDACKAATGTVRFEVGGKPAKETAPLNPGVPQNVTLNLGAAAAPARVGTGGYADDGASSGMLALALGAVALAAVGGGLAVRRVRR